jgi:glucose/arabinose dehydrogenase
MTRFTILSILAALLSTADVRAQEPTQTPPPTQTSDPTPPPTQTPAQAQTQGVASANAAATASSSDWQNWTFAGSALATAAVGIFVVAMGNGESAPHSH